MSCHHLYLRQRRGTRAPWTIRYCRTFSTPDHRFGGQGRVLRLWGVGVGVGNMLPSHLTNGLAAQYIGTSSQAEKRAKRKVGDEAGDFFITGQGAALVNAEKLADQFRAVKPQKENGI